LSKQIQRQLQPEQKGKNVTEPRNGFVTGAASILCAGFIALGAQAQVVTLTNLNSSATINLNGSGTTAGMTDWTVDGFHNLSQQWFWFRADGMASESMINTIGGLNATTSTDGRTLYTSYFNGSYGVRVDYLLTGYAGGSGISDISENISSTNASATPLEFHFFQYSDFKLGGSPQNTIVQLGRNLRGLFNEASLDKTDPAFRVALSETVVTPGANHGEVGVGGFTFGRLTDNSPTTLNDNAGPAGGGLTDPTWAFEWDFVIAPGSSVGISKDKYLQIVPIPEPGTAALVGIGCAMALIWRRRRNQF
jgi:hypothetical protein